jgi:hypothetical protein
MTSAGSPYTRFQHALATHNLNIIRAAAAELPRIGVAEAAAMLLVISRVDPDSYERAALRWLAKLCTERCRTDLEDVSAAAAALSAMQESPDSARRMLATVCERAGLPEAARVFASA